MKIGISMAVTALRQAHGAAAARSLNVAVWQSRIAIGNTDSAEQGSSQPLSQSSATRTNYTGITTFKNAVALTTVKIGGTAKSIKGAGYVSTNWPNDVIYKATLSYSDGVGTVYLPITFDGATSKTITAGADWESDDVTILDRNGTAWTMPAGTTVSIRGAAYFSADGSAAGAVVSQHATAAYEVTETCKYNTTFATIDAFLAGGAQDGTTYNSGMVGPYWVTGTYTDALVSALFLGDSIACGNNDLTAIAQASIGWVHHFCKAKNIAYFNYSRHTRQLKHLYDDANGDDAFDVKGAASKCNYAFICLATNDISNGRTLADFKTHLAGVVARLNTNNPNCRVIVTVPFPNATSTDSYATTANQTVVGNSLSIRQWLRSESGASPIADMVALGATVYRIDDPAGVAGPVGMAGAQRNYTVEYMNAGASTGKWAIRDLLTCGNATATAQGDFNKKKKCKLPAYLGSADDILQLIGSRVDWTGGANNGSAGTVQTVDGEYVQLINDLTNDIAVNDTCKLVYTIGADQQHPGAMQHRLIARIMGANTYAAF
jgi:hypothetical protein